MFYIYEFTTTSTIYTLQYILVFNHCTLFTGADFSSAGFYVPIPPNENGTGTSDFVIPQNLIITDDEIDEVVQIFVLVGEIGADVPESFTCFQRAKGETGCNVTMEPTARFGATRIQINDNDGRLGLHVIYT